MISEKDSFVDGRETFSSPKTRRMEYHTERIVTLKCDRSIFLVIVLVGIFFVISTYLSH